MFSVALWLLFVLLAGGFPPPVDSKFGLHELTSCFCSPFAVHHPLFFIGLCRHGISFGVPPHRSTAESVLLCPLTGLLLHSCHISLGFAGLAVVAACQRFVFDVHVKQRAL